MSVNKAKLKDERICQQVIEAYLSEERPTMREIGKKLGLGEHTIQAIVQKKLPAKQREKERVLRLSRSKMGDLNPMKDKLAELHHNYKGECSDGRGYILVLKPKWFTGRKGSKHVFQHHLVLCEALGLTEIPLGWEVHHIDETTTNNHIDNLALVTASGHQVLHKKSPWRKLTPWEKHVYGILK